MVNYVISYTTPSLLISCLSMNMQMTVLIFCLTNQLDFTSEIFSSHCEVEMGIYSEDGKFCGSVLYSVEQKGDKVYFTGTMELLRDLGAGPHHSLGETS